MTEYKSEKHRVHRSQWLRASVLGANDGIISVSSIIIGIAAAESSTRSILIGGVAATVAGAISMAAGEYVSVSSQRDIEKADMAIEAEEIRKFPNEEKAELAKIYEQRGLEPSLAKKVADQLSEKNALLAHARDELGINHEDMANPLLAAISSGISFTVGALVPVITGALFVEHQHFIIILMTSTLLALVALGVFGAKVGGAPKSRAAARVLIWGVLAIVVTYLIGRLIGQSVV